jgi:hypothetical protein
MRFSLYNIYVGVCVCVCMYYIYSKESSRYSDYVTMNAPNDIKNADFYIHYNIFAVTISDYA